MTPQSHTSERAFILRCWLEDETTGWRFILEPIGQDWQRAGFTDAAELLSFLQWNLGQAPISQSSGAQDPQEHSVRPSSATSDQRQQGDDLSIKE